MEQVKARLEYAPDLPASDAMYNQSCNVNFRSGKEDPKKFVHDKSKIPPSIKRISERGRP